MPDNEKYTRELEKLVIFLCDTYTVGQESLTCQETDDGRTDDDWAKVFMAFPTIQGFSNRNYVRKIGNLRTMRLNRETAEMTLKEVYEKLKVGRKEKVEKYE